MSMPLDALILVAKFPTPGSSKTRLTPTLTPVDAASLASAMLKDTILTMAKVKAQDKAQDTALDSTCPSASLYSNITKVIVYAPSDERTYRQMHQLLCRALKLDDRDLPRPNLKSLNWHLIPMPMPMHSSTVSLELKKPDLGAKLTTALSTVRSTPSPHPPAKSIVFIGMDSPELEHTDIERALRRTHVTTKGVAHAHISPAADGGYALLAIPPSAPTPAVFKDVEWSCATTFQSQYSALTRIGLVVEIGRVICDIDEIADVVTLGLKLMKDQKKVPCPTNMYNTREVLFTDQLLHLILEKLFSSSGQSLKRTEEDVRDLFSRHHFFGAVSWVVSLAWLGFGMNVIYNQFRVKWKLGV